MLRTSALVWKCGGSGVWSLIVNPSLLVQQRLVNACRQFSSTIPTANSNAVRLSFKEFLPSSPISKDTAVAKTPVVILHGLFGNKMNWQSIAKALSNRLGQKILTTDARNHGESPHAEDHSYEAMVEDVERLLDEQNIPQAILIGHSMGGKTAMSMALKKPRRVESVIVVDSAPSTSPGSTGFSTMIDAMKSFDTSRLEPLPQQRGRAMKEFEKSMPELMVRQFILTNLVEKDGRVGWRVNLDAIEKHMHDIMEFPVFHNFFGLPALFIAGGNSNYITEEEIPEIKRLFPKAEFVSIAGAGHWVHSEKPAEVMDAMVAFITNKEDQ